MTNVRCEELNTKRHTDDWVGQSNMVQKSETKKVHFGVDMPLFWQSRDVNL